jgi:anti-sigma factor RsiW
MSTTELEELGNRMTCAQAIEFIRSYLADELPESERAVFAAHLAICEDCRNYLASYETTIRLAQQVGETCANAELLPPLPESLLRALLDSRAAQAADDEL